MSTTDQTTSFRGHLALDPVHSSIGFAVKHSGVMTFQGDFAECDAQARGRPAGGHASRSPASEVDDPNLAGHLQTPDFFDAEQFPELRFVSELDRARRRPRLDRRRPDDQAARRIPSSSPARSTGPITDGYGNQRLGLDLETVVNRRDFGINWNADLPGGGPRSPTTSRSPPTSL